MRTVRRPGTPPVPGPAPGRPASPARPGSPSPVAPGAPVAPAPATGLRGRLGRAVPLLPDMPVLPGLAGARRRSGSAGSLLRLLPDLPRILAARRRARSTSGLRSSTGSTGTVLHHIRRYMMSPSSQPHRLFHRYSPYYLKQHSPCDTPQLQASIGTVFHWYQSPPPPLPVQSIWPTPVRYSPDNLHGVFPATAYAATLPLPRLQQ